MPSRADEPPRRGQEPRRGASRGPRPDPQEPDGAEPPERGFGGISDARAYTPRGRTVRESAERGRPPRGGDPFRPALQVLKGGKPVPARDRSRGGAQQQEAAAGRRTERQRAARLGAADEPDEASPRDARTQRVTHPRAIRAREAADVDSDRDLDEPPVRSRPPASRVAKSRTDATRGNPARPVPARRDTARKDTARKDKLRQDAVGRQGAARRKATSPEEIRHRETGRQNLARRKETARARQDAGRTRRPSDVTVVRQGTRTRGNGKDGRRPAVAAVAPPPLADHRRRLRTGTVLALSLFLIIAGRLVVLQVSNTPAYAAKINQLREQRLATVRLPAPRGAIYDRFGNVIVRSVEARYVYTDPNLVKDPVANAARLGPALGVKVSDLVAKMTRHKRPGGGDARFEYLARGVDINQAAAIDAMHLPGVYTARDERRVQSDLAANLIGFTGSELNGLEGMEAKYDDLLRGRAGQRIFERGNPDVGKGELAKEIPGGYNRVTPAQPGSSLVLTIDNDLQYKVQRVLRDRMDAAKATVGGAVVIDTHTGEVLAQASYPSYDPLKAGDYPAKDREDVPSNLIVDPGSVHKALIFGAALQEGLVKPDDLVTVGPAIERGGAVFADEHPHDKGTKVGLPELLAYSSNVGTILLGERLGPQRIYDYQRKFGLGAATGEGVAGESPGRLLEPRQWSGSTYGSVPIGHSVDATLVQMAGAYAAIANDGTYIQPHLVKETIDGQGRRTPSRAPVTRSVLSPDVAKSLRYMLEAVVQVKGATGTRARLDNWRVAGKTGTGELVVNGQYADSNVSSFIGMAPAENPRYVIAVLGIVPKGAGTGGVVAGPAFKEMMEFTLGRYRIPPDGTKPPTFSLVS